jgi:hypothetical protein
MMIHTIEQMTFGGDNGSITGTAVFDVDVQGGLNADIGGVDGLAIESCELTKFHVDGTQIPLSIIRSVSTSSGIDAAETQACEEVQAMIEAGEL